MAYFMPSAPGCWLFTDPANQPQGGKGGPSPLLRFPGGGRGFWDEPASPKRAAYASRFRARGLYTIKERLADLGRSAKGLKQLGFWPIWAGPGYLVYRAWLPRIPCLFPLAIWRPAGGQVLLLTLARHGPDMNELVPDLKRLDRTHGFEIPQRPDQVLLEML